MRLRIGRGGRVNLPKSVRRQLDLSEGDYLDLTIVSVRRADEPFGVFHEWSTRADDEAFRDL